MQDTFEARAGLFARRIECEFRARNFGAARELVDQFEREASGATPAMHQRPSDPTELALAETPLSARTCGMIERRFGILFVGQLLELRLDDVLAQRGFGMSIVEEMSRAMTALGLMWPRMPGVQSPEEI